MLYYFMRVTDRVLIFLFQVSNSGKFGCHLAEGVTFDQNLGGILKVGCHFSLKFRGIFRVRVSLFSKVSRENHFMLQV